MKSLMMIIAAMAMATAAGATEMETMICRNGIVSKGAIMAEVVAKCGEPAQKNQREEKRYDRTTRPGKEQATFTIVTVNDWTYNFGPNEFMQQLLFEDGRLVRIESLGYGY